MRVRIIANKIAELNTESLECNIPLPEYIIGTNLDSWLYNNGQWGHDPDYIAPDPTAMPPVLP